MFSYKELSKATKKFSRSELLGSGGFGAVYKGALPSGAVVAVKRIRHESKHGEESFQAEAASLSQIRHRNLVQLQGSCSEGEHLFLVFDYMCNGSLDEWLFRASEVETLPLELRHSVLSGVAAALSYLHEECAPMCVASGHQVQQCAAGRGYERVLGRLRLARLIDHEKVEKTTMMAGTLGYMAPEMPHTGKATKETDLYSFGIMVLEVMCGTRPLDVTATQRGEGVLVDRVWRAHKAGNILQVADSRLGTFPLSNADSSSSGGIELQEESRNLQSDLPDVNPSAIYAVDGAIEENVTISNLLRLGLLCCDPNPEDRPSMILASQLMLQSSEDMETSLPALPECKPQGCSAPPESPKITMRH